MTKFINVFLEFKNEANGTRKFALLAVVVITLGLASLSVTGVVATADWNLLSFLPVLGLIIAVLGAEALATVSFVRMLTARSMKRKIIGFLIFIGLAAVGVHNAENGAKVVWPDRFAESSTSLTAKAGVSQKQADDIGTLKADAIKNAPVELERVRSDIAKLEVFTRKMSAQTPEGIKEAQSEMIPRCGYTGKVDGIRSTLTESAMRSCGEQIRGEIVLLKQRETNLLGGQAAGAVAGPAAPVENDPAITAIDLEEQAAAAFWAWFWLIFMLCVLESARSLSLWAYITDLESGDIDQDRRRAEELAEAEHRKRMAELAVKPEAKEPAPAPVSEPVVSPIAAEAPTSPPEPELTPAQRRGRAGGLAAGQAKAAAKAKDGSYILVPSLLERDAQMQAMKVAAE
jgi:hypothetical protein